MEEPAPHTPVESSRDEPIVGPVKSSADTVVAAPLKKKSYLWLWVTMSIVAVIIAALVASYFVIKNAGDVTAQAYTASTKTYLDTVYDTATSAAADPSDTKKAVEAIQAPVLASTLLGGLSTQYVAAEKLQADMAGNVTALTTKIGGYAQVYSFYTQYEKLYTDLQTLDASGVVAVDANSRPLITTYLKDFDDKLVEVKALIDTTTVPSDLGPALQALGRVFDDMSTNWGAMQFAFSNSNSDAYTAAYKRYSVASNQLDAAVSPITNYFNALLSKTHAAAKTLQVYRNTIQ